MAAPKGNQYWKKRSKHGRDKIIKSPEALAESSDEYFQWCVNNPVIQKEWKGKPLELVETPHPRAFKKNELARFCGVAQWRTLEELCGKKDEEQTQIQKDFSQVLTRIEGIIADMKYTYAVVGMFNSTIVARDLSLKDRHDHTTDDDKLDNNVTFEIIRSNEGKDDK